jgi:hypothetical protein
MKIVDYMKKNKYSILWMAITMIWAVCFVLIAHDGFSGTYEYFISGDKIYANKITNVPFDKLKTGTLSDGTSIVIDVPIDYPYDKVVSIHSKHYNNYAYHVENDNGNTKIVE